MSMKIFRLGSFVVVFVFLVSAFCFDSSALAGNTIGQNTNSATTMTENSNAGTTRRRRGRRQKKPATASADTTPLPATELVAPATAVDTTEQTDLTGTY